MHTLSLFDLLFAFIPAAIVIGVMIYQSLQYKTALYAMARMVLQLLLIGYFLIYIFKAETGAVVLLVLAVMLLAAGWISLRTVAQQRRTLYLKALISISVGGGITLILVTQVVIGLDPWYQPSYMIPLAGMIFANAMTAISLAAERLSSELTNDVNYTQASTQAYQASLIPVINALFAVGLVSLPGMMTGQILSGVSPLIAARYQIMVMAMIFGASGLSVLLFLQLVKTNFIRS
ncbi:MAG: ABC transporter permease [Helicobacteraceae bacterium]|nr:ABC transporter permease [Helicobacteraceae bacterium]